MRSLIQVSMALGLVLIMGVAGCNCEDDPPTGIDAATPRRDSDDAGRVDAPLAAGSLEWVTVGTGPGRQRCYSVAESGDGTLVALCSFEGESRWAPGTPQELTVTPEGEHDIIVLGLAPDDGTLRWHKTVGGPGWESWWVTPNTVWPGGRVAVVFRAGGPLTDTPLPLADVAEGDLILMVVQGDGTVEEMRRLVSGGTFDYPGAMPIVVLPTGGFLLSVQFTGAISLAPGTPHERSITGHGPAERFNTVLARWNPDFTIADLHHLGVDGDVLATALPEPDGGLTIGGWFTQRLALEGVAPLLDHADGLGQAFLTSLDANGRARWAHAWGAAGDDGILDLNRLPDGGLAVGGWYGWSIVTPVTFDVPGADGTPLVGMESSTRCWLGPTMCTSDQFVLTLDADGTPRWLRGVSSPYQDTIRNIDVFDDGAIVVGGFANTDSDGLNGSEPESLTFSDGEIVEVRDRVTLTLRYEADGTRSWTRWVEPSLGWAPVVLRDGRVAQCSNTMRGSVFGRGEANEIQPPHDGRGYDAAVFMLANGR